MFAEAQIVKQGNNYHVKHGDDNGLYVEFFMEPVKNEEKSTIEGRPIYEDKEYITIRIIGDTKTVRTRPVKFDWDGGTPPDTERWPRQYQQFKASQTQTVEGTPINEWAMITRSDARSFKDMGIHTVEQLASLGDNNLTWFGARKMKELAIAYLAQAKNGSGITKLQSENDQLKIELETLKAQIKSLTELAPEKKRGRPKNGENAS